jgi:hypothetical protein
METYSLYFYIYIYILLRIYKFPDLVAGIIKEKCGVVGAGDLSGTGKSG